MNCISLLQTSCFTSNGAISSEYHTHIIYFKKSKIDAVESLSLCLLFIICFYPRTNVSSEFKKILEAADLVDITFSCDGKQFGAHKLVLFACSPYFREVLKVINSISEIESNLVVLSTK